MSMIENIFKLKHKAVEKIVKYSNQMSLRTKIRQGYIVMIILFFFIFVLVVGLGIRNYRLFIQPWKIKINRLRNPLIIL